MRPHHTAHSLPSFPVYSCAFLSAEKFVLGGGGGASRSGIKNKLVRVKFIIVNLAYSFYLFDRDYTPSVANEQSSLTMNLSLIREKTHR